MSNLPQFSVNLNEGSLLNSDLNNSYFNEENYLLKWNGQSVNELRSNGTYNINYTPNNFTKAYINATQFVSGLAETLSSDTILTGKNSDGSDLGSNIPLTITATAQGPQANVSCKITFNFTYRVAFVGTLPAGLVIGERLRAVIGFNLGGNHGNGSGYGTGTSIFDGVSIQLKVLKPNGTLVNVCNTNTSSSLNLTDFAGVVNSGYTNTGLIEGISSGYTTEEGDILVCDIVGSIQSIKNAGTATISTIQNVTTFSLYPGYAGSRSSFAEQNGAKPIEISVREAN